MIRIILIICLCFTSDIYAQNAPLNVAIAAFEPPFIIQGTHKEIYGFDADLMNNLCQMIKRTCQFHIMRFDQLLDAVANQDMDVAIGSITITPERAKTVNFSLPYLISSSRFVEKQSASNQPFSLDKLNNKKIGIGAATVFRDQLLAMGIKNPIIKEYNNIENQMNALSNGNVNIIILDNAKAIYWASNSSDALRLVGPPFTYGYGYGIAVNSTKFDLLAEINQALVQYQDSNEFKKNYTKYFAF